MVLRIRACLLLFVVATFACGNEELPLLAPALRVVTSSLPDGVQNAPYTAIFEAEFGTPPYTWSVDSIPPGGLGFDGDRFTGISAQAGTFGFIALVVDSTGARATRVMALRIIDATTLVPSCEMPGTIDLSGGSDLIEGEFRNAFDRDRAMCVDSSVEAVFRLEVEQVMDLRITSLVPGLVLHVREDSCTGGQVMFCSESVNINLARLEPGPYYLFIERIDPTIAHYEVFLEKREATPLPENDTCETAQPLELEETETLILDAPLAFARRFNGGTCGQDQALYYSMRLREPTKLSVSSTEPVQFSLSRGSCQLPVPLACVTGDSLCEDSELLPGTYRLAVSQFDESSAILPTITVRQTTPQRAPNNDACPLAQVLDLRGTSSVVLDASFAGAHDNVVFINSGCEHTNDAPDVFYAFDLPVLSDVTVLAAAHFRVQVALFGDDCEDRGETRCVSSTGPTTFYGLPAGRYHLAVERTERREEDMCSVAEADEFRLSMEVRPAPPRPSNDLCTASTTVALARVGDTALLDGTTRSANDDVSTLICTHLLTGRTEGPDVFYRLVLGAAGRLRISSAASASLLVALQDTECDSPEAFDCADLIAGPLETTSRLPAGTYSLRVDHNSQRDFIPTDFLLNVELLP